MIDCETTKRTETKPSLNIKVRSKLEGQNKPKHSCLFSETADLKCSLTLTLRAEIPKARPLDCIY